MNTSYKITFNSKCAEKSPLVYSYGNTKDIRINLAINMAVVSFTMGVRKTIDDFKNFKVNIFADAYRKVLLCHACKYGRNLHVKRITVCIDDEEYELNKNNTDDFPLMYSMITPGKFNIGEAFKSNDFLNMIVSKTKSNIQTDLRFVSLYSYLQSKKRRFEIDRFTNLWTSMNAFYNCYYKLYKNNSDPNDRDAINHLADALGFNDGLTTREKRKTLTKEYLSAITELSGIKKDDYKVLYDFALSKSTEQKFSGLCEIAKTMNLDLFSFLLFELPYYLRCNYFHGNQCTMLISSYNDYELRCLETVNYFLDRFLDERIPMLFVSNEEATK